MYLQHWEEARRDTGGQIKQVDSQDLKSFRMENVLWDIYTKGRVYTENL